MYLERFTLPDAEQEEELIMERICETRDCAGFVDNPYPCRLFPARGLRELYFQNMTIIYGGNGSGKSTLLNLIAEKPKLNRIAPFNSGEMVKAYVDACRYEMAFDEEGFRHTVPDGSRIITSDDVFDYMLHVRALNEGIDIRREEVFRDYLTDKYGQFRFTSMEDLDKLKRVNKARSRTLSKYTRERIAHNVREYSNGESGFRYFTDKIGEDGLYLLDEPENSLSPSRQMELSRFLLDSVRYCAARSFWLPTAPICWPWRAPGSMTWTATLLLFAPGRSCRRYGPPGISSGCMKKTLSRTEDGCSKVLSGLR